MSKNFTKTNLFLYTVAHFFVDGMCAITVLKDAKDVSSLTLIFFIFTYNFLAFVTQPLAGYFIDKTNRKKDIILISFLMLATGFLFPINQIIRVILVGLANCLFHVAAGARVLETSNGKIWPLGVFVSTGAIGLSLGMLSPNSTILYFIFLSLLSIVFVIMLLLQEDTTPPQKSSANISVSWLILCALLFCISIRSFMGFVRTAPFENIAYLPLILSAFVFAGKFIGGVLCDYFSVKKTILVFVPLSALFYFIGDNHFILWGIGQFLINISMPITLYLIYQIMPNRPAFGFGLAASFLTPGLIATFFFTQTQIPMWIFGLIFIANFVLLLIGNHKISKKQLGKNVP